MNSPTISTRSFTSADQILFADLSGDFNPVHMDALAARRTQAGALVVHGIHVVLWCLDQLSRYGLAIRALKSLGVLFLKYIYLDQLITLNVHSCTDIAANVEVRVDDILAISMTLGFGERKTHKGETLFDAMEAITSTSPAEVLDISEITGFRGWIPQTRLDNDFRNFVPRLFEVLESDRVGGIALLSTLVGMVCPGKHSIFAGFNINILDGPKGRSGIGFQVTAAHKELRGVQMDVKGSRIEGRVSALLCSAPVEPPEMKEITKLIRTNEFEGTTALIIGGSRGLGATTAKIIAAGGGSAIISYATGLQDAEMVMKEINSCRCATVCTVIHFDAFGDVASQLAAVSAEVTHIYYFATSKIFRQKTDVFSMDLCKEFNRVYIDAFYSVCQLFFTRQRTKRLAVFYPSSVAINTRPRGMTEYSMAKAAGEILCADLARFSSECEILVKRLPRVLTDQTQTVVPVRSEDALTVMLPLVREMQLLGTLREASSN